MNLWANHSCKYCIDVDQTSKCTSVMYLLESSGIQYINLKSYLFGFCRLNAK